MLSPTLLALREKSSAPRRAPLVVVRPVVVKPTPAKRRCSKAALSACVCSHDATAHSHKKPLGCTKCGCICYRTWNVRMWPEPDGLTRLFMSLGTPGAKPWTPEECQRALTAEKYRQRRALKLREIERLERALRDVKQQSALARKDYRDKARQMHEALNGLYASVAAIPQPRA